MTILFHLAFPAYDFKSTIDFYVGKLGCQLGRQSEHAIIFKLASHQIVAHKVDEQPLLQEGIYPRHFGLIFINKNEFEDFVQHLNQQGVNYEIPLKTRFSNTMIEHQSFFLKDPSNNLLEFKYYRDPTAIFGQQNFHQVGET